MVYRYTKLPNNVLKLIAECCLRRNQEEARWPCVFFKNATRNCSELYVRTYFYAGAFGKVAVLYATPAQWVRSADYRAKRKSNSVTL